MSILMRDFYPYENTISQVKIEPVEKIPTPISKPKLNKNKMLICGSAILLILLFSSCCYVNQYPMHNILIGILLIFILCSILYTKV